ncbi:MAG: TIR domain-containing protein [Burkholderiales bacterium]
MATKRRAAQQPPKQPPELLVSRDDAKARLQERIEKGLELKQRRVDTREAYENLSNDFSKWDAFNNELLKRLFTTDELAKEYSFWGVMAIAMGERSLGEKIAEIYKDVDNKIHRIDSIIDRLELIPLSVDVHNTGLTPPQPSASQPRTKKVFVVHGRDEVAKTNLEVFLHEIGLDPVVLHRQADEGMTIIEKFEKYSDVGYAFILLTPDEVAYLASEDSKPDSERTKEFRARPNVIFEFGYFVGKLGRSRVCCLYTGNVSLPSDVSGMIYKRYEKSIEEVAYSVIKDLKASGYAIV